MAETLANHQELPNTTLPKETTDSSKENYK